MSPSKPQTRSLFLPTLTKAMKNYLNINYNFLDINSIWKINADKYPEISDVILNIQKWDMATNSNSVGAANYAVLYYLLINKFKNIKYKKVFDEIEMIELITSTKKYLLKYFDSTNILQL